VFKGGARVTGVFLISAATAFWLSWALMPGVGVTDAERILTLVSGQPKHVLFSSALQLLSAACFALAIPGLARLLSPDHNRWGAVGTSLLAVGACGDAADAVFHQIAYEMVGPGAERAQMAFVFQRMQSFDLLFLLPMIAAFFCGCIALAVGLAQEGIVARWNPWLYVVAVSVALIGGPLASTLGLTGRVIGLIVLGLLSVSVAWIGVALARRNSSAWADQ
jgi:hypothetical protein